MRRREILMLSLGLGLLAAGCPKGKSDYDKGRKAEMVSDYDGAVAYYQNALKADPQNAHFRVKVDQSRFEASSRHVKKGQELRNQGDLRAAAGEFQRAATIDPSSPIAEQEYRKTLQMIAEQNGTNQPTGEETPENDMASGPAELKPLSQAPINLKMANEAKVVFDTVGKLAGLTVIYDPDFPQRRISVELNNVTLEQALEIVSAESKAFWKPVTENVIMVFPDQPQKRRENEEQLVQTFYLSNTVLPQDLTEIVTGIRQLLDLKRVSQVNSQNAIIVRDTPDKLLLIDKIIHDIDKAKPEVVVEVEVLQARTDRLRQLGILPGQTVSAAVSTNTTTTTNNPNTNPGGSTSNSGVLTLNQLRHLNQNNINVTVPSFTANAILTDTFTKVIQNPEIRSVDGQPAKLNIGDRVPVATGSFQAGVGVGAVGGAGLVNPLVNTQFQYIDVGVNINITPRVHPNHEVSLKAVLEVSSVSGFQTIGGISQPIITQNKIEHDVRLKEGEVNILGGLFQRTDQRTLNGWPGLAKIPLLRYLFSSDKTDLQENEVLIVLTPRIVRMPEWTKENLRALLSGTETTIQVKKNSEIRAPNPQGPAPPGPGRQGTNPAGQPGAGQAARANGNPAQAQPGQPARIRFEPAALQLKAGQSATVGIAVDNVTDLYSIPLLLQYDPSVISVEEVQHGGFLSGGTQEIAIVQQINKERGQAIISATRQPNTPGVSGSGTLMGIVVKGLKAGTSNLSIVQVNAKDSQQKAIPLVTSEASVQVQP